MIPINKKTLIKALKYLISIILSLIILVLLSGGLLFFYYVSSAPKLSEAKLKATNSSLIYDSNNNLIADLGSEKRESVTTDSIPLNLVNAITSIEDHRFFKHRGIDVIRIVGSAWHNLTHDTTQGGSTLDQQLIKLAYFSTDVSDQTLKRKAQEAWLALQMERQYTKEEILTFYINKVYMGNGNYGMKTAAKAYYGKELADLTIPQLALLAGIPQAPTQYNPYTQPDIAQARRDIVLQQMRKNGQLSEQDYQAALATPVSEGLQPLQQTSSYPKYLDNYLKEVIAEVAEKTGTDLFSSGLKIYTNVNLDAQQYLWDIYNTDQYIYYPDDDFQVASTVIDVTNGKVIAQLGSRHQDENISFGTNQAVMTDRDWGSTMKPISAYGPAIDDGLYNTTAQALNDSFYYWPGTKDQINNWDRQYYGYMSMQTAIMQSRNVPAVRALEAVGLRRAKVFLNKVGIDYPDMHYSNAISSHTTSTDSKYGASTEKMAAAYAAFANGGIYYKPQYVNKIEFSDGTVQEYAPEGTRAMKDTTAYMMTDMLKTVLQYGTGTNAALSGVFQAGKTGTSNYTDDELKAIEREQGIYYSQVGLMAPDENFVGFTPQYSMAVWTGYKNRMVPVYGNGLRIATSVYKTMMRHLVGYGNKDFVMPDGLYRDGGMLYVRGATNYNTYIPVIESSTEDSSKDSSSSSGSSSNGEGSTADATSASLVNPTP